MNRTDVEAALADVVSSIDWYPRLETPRGSTYLLLAHTWRLDRAGTPAGPGPVIEIGLFAENGDATRADGSLRVLLVGFSARQCATLEQVVDTVREFAR